MTNTHSIKVGLASALCVSLMLLATPASAAEAIARAALVTGLISTTATDGGERILEKGDAVYVGDTIATGRNSFANLVFTDGGKVLLRPETTFKIDDYVYEAAATAAGPRSRARTAETGRSYFSLIKGGFRALTGAMAKIRQDSYKVTTTVATIGIRGTDFVASFMDCTPETCGTASLDSSPASAAMQGIEVASSQLTSGMLAVAATPPAGQGLVVGVENGGVSIADLSGQVTNLDPGQYAFTSSLGVTQRLPLMPTPFIMNQLPNPDDCN